MQEKSNEWYTPATYIEAARLVMCGIELDPASCEMANRTVKAARYYSMEENGLLLPWRARSVWLNPPYGRLTPDAKGGSMSYQKIFVEKMIHEYTIGNFTEGIALLLGNACYSRFFQPLWAYPLCIHTGKIKFTRMNGTLCGYGYGSIFVYMGPNEEKFTEVFSTFGKVVKALMC